MENFLKGIDLYNLTIFFISVFFAVGMLVFIFWMNGQCSLNDILASELTNDKASCMYNKSFWATVKNGMNL